MPTYQYECEGAAKHQFEAIQKISEAPLTECPECQSPVHRIISGGIGLIFNGKGFYQTDYKGANASMSSGSKKSEESKSESTSTTTDKPAGGCGGNCSCHH